MVFNCLSTLWVLPGCISVVCINNSKGSGCIWVA
ncbi:hypothetical protein CIPAW_15G070800 [Carya illinoinensis]|uniref:Uncharacterized protein n=1 Tax=Carya illinoinensis TaxID=32201 RepID=A0A8T1NCM0_CARIL|nr:hypothetical protein CIPAW_15G070800 [Carya illinoinensis]